MINFTHRLEGYDQSDPQPCSLIDSIDSSSRRAESIITMLQGDFIKGMNELNNETIFNALEAIRLECIDMRKTVDHFNQSQKNPNKFNGA